MKNKLPPISDRHKEALDYAVNKIKEVIPEKDLNDIILYGSIARNDGEYGSDVDLVVLVSPQWLTQNKKKAIALHADCIMDDYTMPEADIHIYTGILEDQPDNCYWTNVREDGIVL